MGAIAGATAPHFERKSLMKAYTRDEIVAAVRKEQIIVIVRGVAKKDLIPLAEAMYEGGIRLLEITYDATGKTPRSETAENIKMLSEYFEGRMYVGAGTVLDEECVALTKEAGGCFIISPDTNAAVIAKTRELGMVSMPGALTPTECAAAHRAGADFVKLFPIDSLGVSYLKAIAAPLSHIQFLAVGGVNTDNIAVFKAAGAAGFGVGSNIVSKDLIAKGDYAAITDQARRYVEALRS